MSGLVIAPLAPEALDACAAIAGEAPDPWSRDALARTPEDPRRLCLGAFEAAGQAPASPALDQKSATLLGFAAFFIVEDSADLEMLVVTAAARRRGVARRLLAAGEDALARRGARRLLLEVRAGNAPAVGLYQTLGFKQLALRPAMYDRPREDGLLMAKELQEKPAP